MNPLVFLLVAVVASIIGTIILWSRHREPDSPGASVEAFNAKMRALADETGTDSRGTSDGPLADDERRP